MFVFQRGRGHGEAEAESLRLAEASAGQAEADWKLRRDKRRDHKPTLATSVTLAVEVDAHLEGVCPPLHQFNNRFFVFDFQTMIVMKSRWEQLVKMEGARK